MDSKVRLTTEASADFVSIVDYYNEQSRIAAKVFMDEFDDLLKLMIEFPEIGPMVEENVRRVPMRSHPYNVYYITEDHNVIVILAVLHGRRNPETVNERTQQ